MKKTMLTLLGALFLSTLLLTSCKKCVTCGSCPTGVTVDGDGEMCEDDFDSKEDYDAAVEIIEALGCSCK